MLTPVAEATAKLLLGPHASGVRLGVGVGVMVGVFVGVRVGRGVLVGGVPVTVAVGVMHGSEYRSMRV